jgi:hypothetical protein
MDAELKTKWLAALRSGEYSQTQQVLHRKDPNGYCCLGVLCEISESGTWDSDGTYYKFHEKGVDLMAGGATVQRFLPWTISSNLANMNDDGTTFPEIADWIEENVPSD